MRKNMTVEIKLCKYLAEEKKNSSPKKLLKITDDADVNTDLFSRN